MIPDDPRHSRNAHLASRLRLPLIVALLVATTASLSAGEAQELAAGATVIVLIAAPLLRLAWMGNRWRRRDDMQFAYGAIGLATVIGCGAIAAALI